MPSAPPFTPARGLGHPMAQTAFAILARRLPRVPVRREVWDTPDGDFIEVDLVDPADDAPARGFVILVHGLEGSSRSQYMVGMLERARAARLLGIALNLRGCGDQSNRLARCYHSGHTDDLRFVVDTVGRRWPRLRGAVAGFSLGANIATKYLAEEGAERSPNLAGAVAVSCPFDLGACADHLDLRRNFFIRNVFLASLKKKALEKADRFPDSLAAAAIRRAATLRAYDDVVTARLNGFAGAEDYYRRSSAKEHLDRVARPLLFVSALDDPLIPAALIPRDRLALNPHLRLEATPAGGHVGFVAGSLIAPRFWVEERTIAFVEELVRRA